MSILTSQQNPSPTIAPSWQPLWSPQGRRCRDVVHQTGTEALTAHVMAVETPELGKELASHGVMGVDTLTVWLVPLAGQRI